MNNRTPFTIIVLAISFVISSCTYVPPVKKVEGELVGLKQATEEVTNNEGTLRLFVIHGMKNHDDCFSDPLVESLCSSMKLCESNPSPSQIVKIKMGDKTVGKLRIRDLRGADNRQIVVYALNWTPSTCDLKARQFQTDILYQKHRLWGDQYLKRELMDDALADVVLYLGANGEEMRHPIIKSFEMIWHDMEKRPNDRIGVVSFSLGSYMVFDTLLRTTSNNASCRSSMSLDSFTADALIQKTEWIYMMANQLPLLELSKKFNILHDFANRRELLLKGPRQQVGLHYVAFSDPNDLLSYPLNACDVMASDRANSAAKAEYTNVTCTVANWSLLNLVANPLTAHIGYETDHLVLDLLVEGYPKFRSPK